MGGVKLGADGSGEEVCGDRGVRGVGGLAYSKSASLLRDSRWHHSIQAFAPRTASPLTSPLPHPLFAANTRGHTHIPPVKTGGCPDWVLASGQWDRWELCTPHSLETGHPTPLNTRTQTRVLQRNCQVIKSLNRSNTGAPQIEGRMWARSTETTYWGTAQRPVIKLN